MTKTKLSGKKRKKLTVEEVIEIRELIGKLSNKEITSRYQIALSTMSRIRTGWIPQTPKVQHVNLVNKALKSSLEETRKDPLDIVDENLVWIKVDEQVYQLLQAIAVVKETSVNTVAKKLFQSHISSSVNEIMGER